MKFSRKPLIKIGILAFIVFLAIYYWQGVADFATALLSGAKSIIIGAAIAYIVNILMSFYERHYFPKKKDSRAVKATRPAVCMLAAVLTFLLIISLVIGVVIPQFIDCIKTLINMIPQAMEKLEETTLFSKLLPEYVSSAIETMNWENAISKAIDIVKNSLGGVVGGITTVVSSLFSGIITTVVSIIFAFYFLLGKKRLAAQADCLVETYLPEVWQDRVKYAANLLDSCFHKFIVGQCIEAVILGVLCFIGMTIFGFDYAPMIAALIGLTALIPVAGAYIGAGVGAFMILTVSPQQALLFLVFIIVLQQLEGNLIYPRVVGTSIGLPGIYVLAAVTIGGALSGVIGMLAGVPITAAVYQAIRDNVKTRESKKAPDTSDGNEDTKTEDISK